MSKKSARREIYKLKTTNSTNNSTNNKYKTDYRSATLNRPDKKSWIKACDEEFQSLIKYRTWEIEELPVGKTPVDCRWLFKKSLKRPGLDYDETFSQVASGESVLEIASRVYYNLHKSTILLINLQVRPFLTVHDVHDVHDVHYVQEVHDVGEDHEVHDVHDDSDSTSSSDLETCLAERELDDEDEEIGGSESG
ncbi:hypothetical protein V1512DRAFT_293505 [Lipomyces arxii]|uniref:uncharacterized protein n=1 Tax=Lipomyces arxii TaxID=56418 RepID=UPI0034CF4737